MKRLRDNVLTFLRPPSLGPLAEDPRVIETAKTLISYYYYIVPFAAFMFTTAFSVNKQNFDPLWPLLWTQFLSLEFVTVVQCVKLLFIVAALIGAFLHRHRSVRFFVFLSIWQVHALESSFGSVNHQWYLWLYTSLIFVFLPDLWDRSRPKTDTTERSFLLYVWFAQASVALIYTMAGAHKLMYVVIQYAQGQVHGFSVDGFAHQIAYFTSRLQEDAMFAPYIIEHPMVAWIPYVALNFIQFFSLWVMVRPSLQKIWALLIVMFHIGTYLTMGISFHPHVLLVIILFFNSPFYPKDSTWRDTVNDVPIVGPIFTRLWPERVPRVSPMG